TRFVFGKPWLLFFWFCALIMTLQVSILRHTSLRRQLIQTLSVTMISIILVIIIDLIGDKAIRDAIESFIRSINLQVQIQDFGSSPWTYTIINFGVLGVYGADSLRRWTRRAQGKSPVRRAAIGLNDVENREDMPTLSELVSGDLIAGALLALVLSFILHQEVI